MYSGLAELRHVTVRLSAPMRMLSTPRIRSLGRWKEKDVVVEVVTRVLVGGGNVEQMIFTKCDFVFNIAVNWVV